MVYFPVSCHFISFGKIYSSERPDIKHPQTRSRGRVVNIPASYAGGPGFKSRSKDWLSWLMLLIVSLGPSRRLTGQYLQMLPLPLPFKFFQVHHYVITLSFDAT
jgi:hypothetical protein